MKTKLISWFLQIKWVEILTSFILRILIIPFYLLLIIIGVLAAVINVLIWLVTGKGYINEIENTVFYIGNKFWNKAFPNNKTED